MSVTAIVDWQGACIWPLFETPPPRFVDVDNNTLIYPKVSSGDLE